MNGSHISSAIAVNEAGTVSWNEQSGDNCEAGVWQGVVWGEFMDRRARSTSWSGERRGLENDCEWRDWLGDEGLVREELGLWDRSEFGDAAGPEE